MKKPKTRKELRLEFIRETERALTKRSCEYTHHKPVDDRIDQARNPEIVKGDLIKYKGHVAEVTNVTGMILDAEDLHTKEVFIVLAYNVEKL